MKACFLKLRKLRRCKTNYGKSDYKERTARKKKILKALAKQPAKHQQL